MCRPPDAGILDHRLSLSGPRHGEKKETSSPLWATETPIDISVVRLKLVDLVDDPSFLRLELKVVLGELIMSTKSAAQRSRQQNCQASVVK